MEIKDLLKELVTDEQIENAVRYAVSEKFDYYLDREIEKKINEVISGKADEYIYAEIDKVMENKVRIDDGWGNSATYASFDDYVRMQISTKIRDGWKIERKVRDAVDSRLKKYVEESVKKINDERVGDVLVSMARDILDGESNAE